MNLGQLIATCRLRTDDLAEPYLWSDDEWIDVLNEAVNEACVRARLLTRNVTVSIQPGTSIYTLPAYVIDVEKITDAATGREIPSQVWNATRTDLVLYYEPSEASSWVLSTVCIPETRMTSDTHVPAIPERYHLRLIDWAISRAYLKNDADAFNPNASAVHAREFSQSFGEYFDANVQRKHRRNSPRVVRMGSGW